MNIGKVIHEIRLNKNIPVNKVYQSLLSRPVISKFEKGLSDTTVNRFLKILDNLHMTLEEFEITYLRDENRHSYYTNGYIKYYGSKDIKKLEELQNEAIREYENTGSEKFNHYQAVISLLISELTGTKHKNQSIFVVQNYLMKCDNWGYYEVTLFSNTLSFLLDELVDLVYKQAAKLLLVTQMKKRYRNEFSFLVMNILEMKILSKNMESMSFYLSELKKMKLDTVDNMYTQAMIKYFTAIVEYIITGVEGDAIHSIINTFNFLEMLVDKELCEDFYTRVKKLYFGKA